MMLNAFSIDVEEYFQVHNFEEQIERQSWSEFESRLERSLDRILLLLERHEVHATFFVLCWHADRLRSLVRRLHDAGHEIGSHGCEHRLVYTQTAAEFRADIRRSKRYLEDLTGDAVGGYRAPSYSITKQSTWALAELKAEGFQYDSSIYPMRRRRYGIPDAPRHPHLRPEGIVEFPMSTWRLLGINLPAASGAYLRLFPPVVAVRAIRQLNAAGHPAVVNIHPWDLDPEQPRLAGGYLGGLTHYVNLHRTEGRLDRLLGRFRFGTMRRCLEETGLLGRATPGAQASAG